MSNAASAFTSNASRTRTIFSELERVLPLEEMFVKNFEGGATFVVQVKEALEFGRAQNETIGFIHNDYRPSNVFFDENNQVTGIIDFDWSCMGPVIKDLALAIVEWSFPDGAIEADMTLFQEFLDGYNSVSNHQLEKDEKLYSWIKFATLSDAATYFCDLAEDPESTKRIIKSYMYRKFVFFSQETCQRGEWR
jgi:Ser/Thr protein kinase RdoA (MazF antagonist)